jgi:TRAP-type transport system small permease protein
MESLRRTAAAAARLASWLCAGLLGVALATMFVSVLVQVVLRSGFRTTWLALDDLVVYTFAVATFSGAALLFREGGHIATPILLETLSGTVRRIVQALVDLALAAFLLLLLLLGWDYARDAFGQFSPLLRVPVGVVFLVVPIAGGTGLIFLIERWLGVAPEPRS